MVWKMDIVVQMIILLVAGLIVLALIATALIFFFIYLIKRGEDIPEDVRMEYWKYYRRRGIVQYLLIWTFLFGFLMAVLMGDFRTFINEMNVTSLVSLLTRPLTGLILGLLTWYLKETRYKAWVEKKKGSTRVQRSKSLYKNKIQDHKGRSE